MVERLESIQNSFNAREQAKAIKPSRGLGRTLAAAFLSSSNEAESRGDVVVREREQSDAVKELRSQIISTNRLINLSLAEQGKTNKLLREILEASKNNKTNNAGLIAQILSSIASVGAGILRMVTSLGRLIPGAGILRSLGSLSRILMRSRVGRIALGVGALEAGLYFGGEALFGRGNNAAAAGGNQTRTSNNASQNTGTSAQTPQEDRGLLGQAFDFFASLGQGAAGARNLPSFLNNQGQPNATPAPTTPAPQQTPPLPMPPPPTPPAPPEPSQQAPKPQDDFIKERPAPAATTPQPTPTAPTQPQRNNDSLVVDSADYENRADRALSRVFTPDRTRRNPDVTPEVFDRAKELNRQINQHIRNNTTRRIPPLIQELERITAAIPVRTSAAPMRGTNVAQASRANEQAQSNFIRSVVNVNNVGQTNTQAPTAGAPFSPNDVGPVEPPDGALRVATLFA